MKFLNIKNSIIGLLSVAMMLPLVGCKDDLEPIIEEIELDRVLSPSGLRAFIRNQTSIELNWTVRKGADSYVVEFSEDSLQFNEIIRTVSVLPEDLPIRETFFGDTRYSARVKAIADGENESNWATITIRTNPEQIFLPLPGINVQDTYATLIWTPGLEVTNLLIQPGNIYVPLSAQQKADGEATVQGLDGATTYTATIYNGSKKRGSVSFSTLKEANVTPLDNLATEIANAPDGAVLILAEGEYNVGEIPITKSITIEGQKSYDMPVIYGRFTFGVPVTSVTIKTLDMRYDGSSSQAFNTSNAAANVGTLLIDGCEISGYTNNIIYNQALGTYGNVTIRNSYIHDIQGAGGDGFDIRGGTFTSLTVENTTFSTGVRSFLRMQVASNVAFRNCTFYKICTVASSNNRGFFRSTVGGSLEVSKCLFVETGVDDNGTLRGNWTQTGDVNGAVTTNFLNNYYYNTIGLFDGQFNATQCGATEANPGFENPANGDFTITNQTLIDNQIGDPRWWF